MTATQLTLDSPRPPFNDTFSTFIETAQPTEPVETAAVDSLTAWEKVALARHRYRPHTLDYIRGLCSDFIELRGDRSFGDDRALLGGIGRTQLGPVVVMGHQKGRDTRENVRHNFGMPHPEGYRKALRLMRHAEKFNMPLICFIDTPGAQPNMEAEARGQAQAIAECLLTLARLPVPIIAVVIGEGGSGGALAIGLGDRILMLEHAIYSVAAPEASAAILWRDATQAAEAARMMKITAQDLGALGVIDEILPEPLAGAHTDPDSTITTTIAAVLRNLNDLRHRDPQDLLWERYARYRAIGCFQEGDRAPSLERIFVANDTQAVPGADTAILASLKELFRNVLEENEQEYVDFDTLTAQTQLRDLPLDSLALVELMYGIEERFHVHIPEAKAFEFQTFADVIQCIQAEQAGK